LIERKGATMDLAGRIVYSGMLGCFVLIAIMSAIAGVWYWTIGALVLGLAFGVSAPYVFGKRWRPEPPKSHVRAVTRRRR
jgi:hypothetical protein